jgi:hypothetical protein
LHINTAICTGTWATPSSCCSSTTEVVEELLEDFLKATKASRPIEAGLPVYASRAVTVITGAFVVVREDFIGLVDFFELGFSIIVIADIWMLFAGELAECFIFIVFASTPGNPQQLVIIVCHKIRPHSPANNFHLEQMEDRNR